MTDWEAEVRQHLADDVPDYLVRPVVDALEDASNAGKMDEVPPAEKAALVRDMAEKVEKWHRRLQSGGQREVVEAVVKDAMVQVLIERAESHPDAEERAHARKELREAMAEGWDGMERETVQRILSDDWQADKS